MPPHATCFTCWARQRTDSKQGHISTAAYEIVRNQPLNGHAIQA
jgi:hypothetical protein